MLMQILNVFDKYFLMMMIVLGFVAISADSAMAEKEGNHKKSRLVKALGLIMVAISLTLYIVHNIYA